MRWLAFIVFFLYVYLEISFFVVIANAIGVFLALICIIATSILGFSLVKSQGIKNLAQMQQKMANQENPTQELFKSISLFLAGFLLLIPGFLTDILGALLLLPPIQNFVAKYLVPKFNISAGVYTKSSYSKPQNNDSDIIEGEFSRKDDE